MPENEIKCDRQVNGIAFEIASLSCVGAKYTSVVAAAASVFPVIANISVTINDRLFPLPF